MIAAVIHDKQDAKLIAAAPELLEACKAMLPMIEDYQAELDSSTFKGSRNFVQAHRAKLESIKAAIHKATKQD